MFVHHNEKHLPFLISEAELKSFSEKHPLHAEVLKSMIADGTVGVKP